MSESRKKSIREYTNDERLQFGQRLQQHIANQSRSPEARNRTRKGYNRIPEIEQRRTLRSNRGSSAASSIAPAPALPPVDPLLQTVRRPRLERSPEGTRRLIAPAAAAAPPGPSASTDAIVGDDSPPVDPLTQTIRRPTEASRPLIAPAAATPPEGNVPERWRGPISEEEAHEFGKIAHEIATGGSPESEVRPRTIFTDNNNVKIEVGDTVNFIQLTGIACKNGRVEGFTTDSVKVMCEGATEIKHYAPHRLHIIRKHDNRPIVAEPEPEHEPVTTKAAVPKPPRSITFSKSVESVMNRLGRPLKDNNEIYSLSNLREYQIYQRIKGRTQSHDQVVVTDYNAAENPILKPILSDKVLKRDDEGKREIARIIEKNKQLKNGIVVKRGAFYFIIQNIENPRVDVTYKNRDLTLLRFPPLTPELELKGVINEFKTSQAFDYEVEIPPMEELVHLYLNKVFDHINAKMPNAINKDFMRKIKKAAEEYESTGSIQKSTNGGSDNSSSDNSSSDNSGSTTTTSGSDNSDNSIRREDEGGDKTSPKSPASVAPSTILGALPSDIKIRRISMADYNTLPNKNIPVIIESEPNTIKVMNGLACKVMLDNLGKLGSEEDKWRKLLFIKPNEQFKTIRDVLPEQVCFIILFTHMFFTAVVSNPEIQTTQSSSFRQKFKHVQTLLQPLAATHETEFKKLWDTLQIEYINNAARNITFDQIKAFIISGPQHLMQYFEEATRIHLGETIPRRFFQVAPVRRESASVASGDASPPTGPLFP